MSKTKELIIEDWERLSELDKMYLQEQEHQMICDWQQYEEREPANVTIKYKEQIEKVKNYKH